MLFAAGGLIIIMALLVILRQPPSPTLLYLSPASHTHAELWAASLEGPPRQLTETPSGVYDFAPGPKGRYILYSELVNGQPHRISLLNLDTGESRIVQDCGEAICRHPTWHTINTNIVLYERIAPGDPPRVWRLNLKTGAAHVFLPYPARHPVFSPDGGRLAYFDPYAERMRVIDLKNGASWSGSGVAEDAPGRFSPDGEHLLYLTLQSSPQGFIKRLNVANMASGLEMPVNEGLAYDDGLPAWYPSHDKIAVPRKSPGVSASQLWLLDPETLEWTQVTEDPDYNSAAFRWSPSGRSLTMQRLPFPPGSAPPEIWVYDAEAGKMKHVAADGFLPDWLP